MRVLYPVFIIMLVMSTSVQADLKKVIKTVKPSIVAIGTHMPTRNPSVKILGTGFVINHGRHVVTNAHVIPDILDSEKKESLVIISGRGRQLLNSKATVLATDSTHDLALLAIQGKKLPAMKLASSAIVDEGTEIAFTGFPIGMVLGMYPATHRGIISAISPIVIPAISSKQLTAAMIRRMRNPFMIYQLDATAYPGNSGSPIYDTNTGRVIGVINSVLVKKTKESAITSPSGITYAIPVKYVHQLLEKSADF